MPVQTTAWQWPWDAPADQPPAPTPAPQTGNSPEQDAQQVITRFWRWQAAGGKTVDTGQKNAKNQPILAAVDPDTGLADDNFPTTAEVNAAEALLTRKQSNDPATVQAAKDQAKATLDETKARTAATLATLTQKQGPPATVQPGEGVLQADGTYSVPVPTKPPSPQKTQAQIDQEAADAHNKAVGPQKTQDQLDTEAADAHKKAVNDLANTQTPQQQLAAHIAEINATAHAQGDAALNELQAKVDAGLVMSESDKLKLTSDLALIQSDHDAQIRQAQDQYAHDLAQPNVDAANRISQQNADTSRQNADTLEQQRQDQARQADVNQQSDVLKAQAAQGQSNIDTIVKAGSAIPMSAATLRMATDPLQLALHLSRMAVQSGQVPATAMPVPNPAPQPAATPAPPSAPLPATGAPPPTNQLSYGAM